MQTTLLGLAIAIILALVTALVAPLVVDWNQYRSTFEDEASRLTGLAVRVSGPIEARILPTPRIKLGDVAVGEPGRQPQLRVGAIDVEVGLGPLLRGRLQAAELRLVAPQIALGLDRSGAIGWPAPPAALSPDALAISRLHVEDGSITLADAGSGARVVLQKLRFDGDIRSFAGPFRGDGAFVVGDDAYDYRISASHMDEDGGLRLRLGVDPSDRPLTTEIDGTLSFNGGDPQFDGTLALARPVGVALARGQRVVNEPWQLAGKVRATPASASLQDLAFQYGPEERAVNFSGKAELTFGAHPSLNGTVSAVQVDVDRALAAPDVTHRLPFVMMRSFLEAFVAAVKPPVPVTVGVAVEALTIGGTTLQSLHGTVGFDDRGWSVKDLGFHAPGFTEVNLSGRLDDGARGLAFSGPASLKSADLKMLMAWLEGRREAPVGRTEAFAARGMVSIASNRLALDRLSASLDQEKLEGRLAYAWAAADRPASLDGELHAAKLDVDALTAFAKAAMSQSTFEMPRAATLVIDVGSATFAGIDARKINARVKFDAGVLHIDRLSVGDLGGSALDVSGRIDELSSQPRGRLMLDLDAKTLAGLAGIAGKLVQPEAAQPLRHLADHLAPAKIHSVLTVDRAALAGTLVGLDLAGDAGALRVAINGDVTGDLAHPGAASLRVSSRLHADDGGALARLLNLDRILAVDQLPGEMTIAAAGPLDGDVRVNGLAAAGGFALTVEGTLHPSGDDAPTGRLQVKASAADLRPLHRAMTGQPGSAVPLTATSRVAVAGGTLSFSDLEVAATKASLHGRLAVKLSSPIGIDGDIEASDADAAAAALMLGLPSAGAGAAWSAEPIGPGAFGALSGAVTFKLDRTALTPAWTARDLKGVVRFEPAAIVFSDIEGELAGGRLTGEVSFRRDASELAAQGRLTLSGAKATTILASKKNAVDGALTVELQADGAGLSPAGFIGAVHGSGTVKVADLRVAGIDPAAFEAAIRVADQTGAIETPKIRAAVGAAMDSGRLMVPQSEAEVTIAGGQIRLAQTILPAQSGAKLLLDGILDLNSAAVDANVMLSAQPPPNSLISTRPELALTLKGPLAAPESKLDISALVGWLTLRATELQTRRLRSIEANQRAEARGPIVRPASPSVRYIPAGTTVETAIQSDAAAAPAFGSRGPDRLRPEAPPALPEGRLHQDGADQGAAAPPLPSARPKPQPPGTESASARRAPPPPATPQSITPSDRSLLDMLFRSQN